MLGEGMTGQRVQSFRMFGVLVGVGLAVVWTAKSLSTSRSSVRHQLPVILHDFHVSETYTDTPGRFRALYKRHDHIARIDMQGPMGHDEAASLIEQRMRSLQTIYDRHVSPYPGELSSEIVCDDSYKPILGTLEAHGVTVQFVKGLATARFTFGACVDDLVAYKGAVAWYWCPLSQTVVQLELMIPKEEPEAEPQLARDLNAIRCDE